ncbi:GNAT family N-acetyltransferase [Aliiruegeria lutimaris]|uniref:Acetyltransferase (GNAT) family protein n=1 Tax=Aliiruegeria lutimaris TaxID=571298 RepID=A0A1G8KXP7_9RHOB|nr:GNAT family N-acetyltransferase [Aliiruegeria lutimaris]SDI48172.1 Acetyltransferase (GNAT) family protein [Aliiruegeria lutimaris]
MLNEGCHDVPDGMLAMVVTHLEMRAQVAPRPVPQPEGVELRFHEKPDVDWYRALFRQIGAEEWLWFSRLRLSRDALEKILHHPDVALFSGERDGESLGLLELDFRQEGECELVFFGLAPPLIGGGVGRWLMNSAIEQAWSRPISRFHLHTCTLDHPSALSFYRRSGFVPFRRQVEIAADPRVVGELPESCGPHMPLIR